MRRVAPNNSTESTTHPADQANAAPITPKRSVSIHAATRYGPSSATRMQAIVLVRPDASNCELGTQARQSNHTPARATKKGVVL